MHFVSRSVKKLNKDLLLDGMENFVERFLIFCIRDLHSQRGRANHLQSAANCVIEYVERFPVYVLRDFPRELIRRFDEHGNE